MDWIAIECTNMDMCSASSVINEINDLSDRGIVKKCIRMQVPNNRYHKSMQVCGSMDRSMLWWTNYTKLMMNNLLGGLLEQF